MNVCSIGKTLLVGALLAVATIALLMAVACFGGGDGDGAGSNTTVSGSANTGDTSSEATTTTVVAFIDPLSSFKSKDPFIPQAQATTTTAPPSTLPPTTAPPTTAAPTTTVAPGLKVLGFDGTNTSVTFSVNGYTIAHRGGTDDNNVYVGSWGKLKVLEVNFGDPAAPWATFLRDDTYKYEQLRLGETRTW